MAKEKIYVGKNISLEGKQSNEIFRCAFTPTHKTHGEKYIYVIGEFRTLRGAEFYVNYGANNPHICHVNDAEKLAKKYHILQKGKNAN